MGMGEYSRSKVVALAIAAIMLIELAMAANYTVGDSDGWEIGTDFESWVSSKKFFVGDVLLFEYSSNHNVLEVNDKDFSSCEGSNPITQFTGGMTSITLSGPKKVYFICGVAGHCSAGMKIEIDTLAAAPPLTTPPSPIMGPQSSPAKSPSDSAPPPGIDASPPAPPTEPSSSSPSSAPTPEPDSSIPPFPFDLPLNPSASPTNSVKPPPPPSSAYKCSFGVDLSIGFGFVILMLLAI